MTTFNDSNGRVLITDAISPRTLSACRSLGRRNISVTCAGETKVSLAFFSRYCQARFTLPSAVHHADAFACALLNYLEQHPHHCLIPIKEESLDAILAYRHDFEQLTHLPLVDTPTFQICRNKAHTLELAEQVGVPYPRTVYPAGPYHLLAETVTLRYPLVIKPRFSCAGEGISHVHNEQELIETYGRIHDQYPFPLVQEEIPAGEKYDVCCLFDENSQPIVTFVQQELRNFPLQNGPSTLQKSVWRPDLVDLTVQMLQKIGWYGVAEAEFIVDPRDGTPVLMEINPRLWGSLELATQCGVDFPYLLYRLACGQHPEPIHTYKVGHLCRQLLPYDLMHFLANPQRFALAPNFFDFFNRDCGYTVLSAHDPIPILGFFLASGRYLFDAEMWLRLARMETVSNWLGQLKSKKDAPSYPLPDPNQSNTITSVTQRINNGD